MSTPHSYVILKNFPTTLPVIFLIFFIPKRFIFKGCTPSNLEQANWIYKSKHMRRNMSSWQKFTLQSVEITDIEVAWHDSSSSGCTMSELKPEDIKKVKLLEPMDSHYLELGEIRFLKLNSSDVLVKKKYWLQKLCALYNPEFQKIRHVVTRNNKR